MEKTSGRANRRAPNNKEDGNEDSCGSGACFCGGSCGEGRPGRHRQARQEHGRRGNRGHQWRQVDRRSASAHRGPRVRRRRTLLRPSPGKCHDERECRRQVDEAPHVGDDVQVYDGFQSTPVQVGAVQRRTFYGPHALHRHERDRRLPLRRREGQMALRQDGAHNVCEGRVPRSWLDARNAVPCQPSALQRIEVVLAGSRDERLRRGARPAQERRRQASRLLRDVDHPRRMLLAPGNGVR